MTKLSFKYPYKDPLLTNNSDPKLQEFCDLALTEIGRRNCFPNPADGPFVDGSRTFDENMALLINMITPYVDKWHTGS